LKGKTSPLLNLYSNCQLFHSISFFASFHLGTYHCVFRYKNSYSVATKDVTIHPLPLESNIMIDPLEASGLCTDSHSFKCCIEDGGDYTVTFQVDSSSFSAGKTQTAKLPSYVISYMWNLK
jgi:G protein-coupled receptor 116